MTSIHVQPAAPVVGGGRPAAQRKPRFRVKPQSGRVWTLGIGALVLYLFVVHSYKINIGSAAIAVGLFTVLAHERPIRISTSMYWYAGYLAWALLNIPAANRPDVSLTAWIDALKLLLIMFMALNCVRTPRQYRVLTLAWLGLFAFYPVRGTLANFLTGNGDFGRYGWNFVFGNFNDMAALTLIPLALSIDRLRTPDKNWVRACALAGVIALPFIILITQSRAGMLGMAAMVMFLLVRSRYRSKLIMAVAGVGLTAVLFAPGAVWERIQKMTYLTSVATLGQSDSSAEQRYLIWQVAESIIADNPVSGVGIGGYPFVHEVYARSKPEWAFARGQRDSHSTYLLTIAETGFIGLALFMMIFFSASYEMYKTSRFLKRSELPEDKQLRDRLQAFQAALVGLSICAVFGGLSKVVFPFLFITLAAAQVHFRSNVVAPSRARRPFRSRPQPVSRQVPG